MFSFSPPPFTQIWIGPSGESLIGIPQGLSVSNENESPGFLRFAPYPLGRAKGQFEQGAKGGSALVNEHNVLIAVFHVVLATLFPVQQSLFDAFEQAFS